MTITGKALQYSLTTDERQQFEEAGYFTINNALSPKQIDILTAEVDRIYAGALVKGFDATVSFFHPNFIPDSDEFLKLVDFEKTLPKVWEILGWNIYLYHAHLIVTPANRANAASTGPADTVAYASQVRTFGWHQDSGRINRDIETHPRPRISLKIAYFLSDVSKPGRGNFWVVPGSHLRDEIDKPADGIGQPHGAIPVLAKPGDAVFFDRRLWHTASPNWSDITRKVLFYGYGYRWIRTKDDMTVDQLWEGSDPIRRQLLGWGINANSFFSPTDDDVPLKVWLEENNGSGANL